MNMDRLPDDEYGELLELIGGHCVGLLVNRYGNVGDELILRGTQELFSRHNIAFRLVEETEIASGQRPQDITLLAEPGGGNLGTRPGLRSPKRRRLLAKLAGPKIILPQSASDSNEDLHGFDTVFAREETTWKMLRNTHADVRMAPDLALSIELPRSQPALETGVFLRSDGERVGRAGVDPAKLVADGDEYIRLAGQFRKVTTNRLHFAIASLLQGQTAVIRRNSYHKNLSMYETWLHRFEQAMWED